MYERWHRRVIQALKRGLGTQQELGSYVMDGTPSGVRFLVVRGVLDELADGRMAELTLTDGQPSWSLTDHGLDRLAVLDALPEDERDAVPTDQAVAVLSVLAHGVPLTLTPLAMRVRPPGGVRAPLTWLDDVLRGLTEAGLASSTGDGDQRAWTITGTGRSELGRLRPDEPDEDETSTMPLAEALARRIDPTAFPEGATCDPADPAMLRALQAASRVLPVLLDVTDDLHAISRALARAPRDIGGMFADEPGDAA